MKYAFGATSNFGGLGVFEFFLDPWFSNHVSVSGIKIVLK